MSQALYRKYRPKVWSEVIGQDHVVQTLKNAVVAGRVGHAYLFAGPRGTGKTTLARILAKAVNCLAEDVAARPCNECENCKALNESRFMDVIEMDAASNTGVDDVRELREKIAFSPSQGKYKIYIIDEAHMLSTAAFNALLKTLEEPPPHAIFVLATTEIHKIPATVLSRCQRHEFRRVAVQEILANLRQITKAEQITADDGALMHIARQATGSMRDAQSLLDQLSSVGATITLELAQSVLGTATSQSVFDLIDSIQGREPGTGLEVIHRTLDAGVDPRTLARQIVDYLRQLMLMQIGNGGEIEIAKDAKEHLTAHASGFSTAEVVRLMKIFNIAASDTRSAWQPALALELAAVEALALPQAPAATVRYASGGEPGQQGGRTDSRRATGLSDASAKPLSPAGRDPSLPKGSENRSTQSAGVDAPGRAESSDGTGGVGQPAPSGIGVAEISRAWKEVRAAIKPAHPAVEALLNSCKPVEVRGDELLLGFQSDTVRALMDKPENLEAASKAIADVVGPPFKIKCVVINVRGKVPPDLTQDGMVATAINHGGQIVDVQE